MATIHVVVVGEVGEKQKWRGEGCHSCMCERVLMRERESFDVKWKVVDPNF